MTELDVIKLALECLLKTTASNEYTKIYGKNYDDYEEFMKIREKYIQSTIKLLNESLTKE